MKQKKKLRQSKSNLKWERPMMNSLKSTSPFPSSSNISITRLPMQVFYKLSNIEEGLKTWRGGSAATLVNSWTPQWKVIPTRPDPFVLSLLNILLLEIICYNSTGAFPNSNMIQTNNLMFALKLTKYENIHWRGYALLKLNFDLFVLLNHFSIFSCPEQLKRSPLLR